MSRITRDHRLQRDLKDPLAHEQARARYSPEFTTRKAVT
jgi:hypothetical protein